MLNAVTFCRMISRNVNTSCQHCKERIMVNRLVFWAALAAATAAQADDTPTPNLLVNGGFEAEWTGGQPPGFRIGPVDSRAKASGNFSLATDAHGGKHALRIERTNTDGGYALWLTIPTFTPASPPKRIAFVCWVKPATARGRLPGPCLAWQAFTPEWIGACRLVRAIEPDPYAGTWGKVAVLLEQIPNATLRHFRFLVEAQVPGDAVFVDDVACFDVTDWPRTAIDALMKHEQEPAPARATDRWPFREGNLLENSSFELGLSGGWSIPGPTPPEQLRMLDPSTAHHGISSVRLDYSAGGQQTLTGRFRPVRVGQTHTLSARVHAHDPGATVILGFENGYVPLGSRPHRFETRKALEPGTWQRIQVSGVAKAGPADAYGIRIAATGPTAGSVWVDSVQFEEGPARPYAPAHPLEPALLLPEPTGISRWDEPVRYTIQVANHTANAIRATLAIQTWDFRDRQVREDTIGPRLFAPGVTIIERAEPPRTRGSQRLRLRINDREELENEITLTVVPPARHPSRHVASRFGQHVRLEPWQLGVAKRLGACWARMHDVDFCLSWDQAEPEAGKWVWADDKIDLAHRVGVDVLGVLGRTPGWALEPEQHGKTPEGGWFYPPDLDAWANYVEAVTRHYRGKVDVWEIWNEPYGFGIGDGTKYAALVRTAYAAAKRGNPDCTLLGLCTHAGATAFNQDAVAGEAMTACDLISYHCYTRDGTDAYRRGIEVREVLGLADNGKKMWMSEGMGGYTFSWHSFLVDAVNDPYSRRPGAPTFSSEAAAVTGARAIANILAAGAEKTFWYWSPWESASSIRPDRYTWFEYDGQLKPYAAAYAVAAHFLDDTRSVGRITAREHLPVCLFERGEEAVAVLWWESDGQTTVVLRPSADQPERPLQAFDMMGNPLNPTNGKLTVTSYPIYVYAIGQRASDLIASLGLK
jgi:hypothetical protein